MADKPRITRFAIDWGLGEQTEGMQQDLSISQQNVNLQSDQTFLLDKTNMGEDKTISLVKDLEKKMGGENPFLA